VIALKQNPVLVVSIDAVVLRGLTEAAGRRGWPLVQGVSAKDALKVVFGHRPRVVVVQVPPSFEEAVAFIEQLRSRAARVLLVGAAASHDGRLEQAVRVAGANCYLPRVCSPRSVEEAVDSLLAADSGRCPATSRPARRATVASVTFPVDPGLEGPGDEA